MTRSALQQVSSFDKLEQAWTRLWKEARPKSRSTFGIDNESLNDFARNQVSILRTVSALLRTGQYQLSDLRPHLVEKPNGGIRVICIPTTRDRIVQGAVLEYLSEVYTKRFSNKVSYGFLKGRTVMKALEVARKKRRSHSWVFKTDVTAFFDQLPRDLLKQKIKRVVRETSLHPILFQAVDSEIDPITKRMKGKLAQLGIQRGRGIRQGMPLSPFFSNIFLERFDHASDKAGMSALRYADDLIFFCDSHSQCMEADAFCRKELATAGLQIPSLEEPNSKSVIFDPSTPAEFLGVAICREGTVYQIRVLPRQIAKIRKALLDLANVSELLARKITLATLGHSLGARKGGYVHAYSMCSNITELENDLDDVEQKVLKRLYTLDLGIDLSKIAPKVRTFLGLK